MNEKKRPGNKNSQGLFHKGLKRLVGGLLVLIDVMSTRIGLVSFNQFFNPLSSICEATTYKIISIRATFLQILVAQTFYSIK